VFWSRPVSALHGVGRSPFDFSVRQLHIVGGVYTRIRVAGQFFHASLSSSNCSWPGIRAFAVIISRHSCVSLTFDCLIAHFPRPRLPGIEIRPTMTRRSGWAHTPPALQCSSGRGFGSTIRRCDSPLRLRKIRGVYRGYALSVRALVNTPPPPPTRPVPAELMAKTLSRQDAARRHA